MNRIFLRIALIFLVSASFGCRTAGIGPEEGTGDSSLPGNAITQESKVTFFDLTGDLTLPESSSPLSRFSFGARLRLPQLEQVGLLVPEDFNCRDQSKLPFVFGIDFLRNSSGLAIPGLSLSVAGNRVMRKFNEDLFSGVPIRFEFQVESRSQKGSGSSMTIDVMASHYFSGELITTLSLQLPYEDFPFGLNLEFFEESPTCPSPYVPVGQAYNPASL
jgi:hypothetical protein